MPAPPPGRGPLPGTLVPLDWYWFLIAVQVAIRRAKHGKLVDSREVRKFD